MAVGFQRKLKQRLIEFLAKRLPPCRLIVPLLSESLERQTSIREKLLIRLHFFTCEACRRYVEHIERLSEMLKQKMDETPEAVSDVVLSSDARDRIKSAVMAATRE